MNKMVHIVHLVHRTILHSVALDDCQKLFERQLQSRQVDLAILISHAILVRGAELLVHAARGVERELDGRRDDALALGISLVVIWFRLFIIEPFWLRWFIFENIVQMVHF